jgi:1,4-alpha-glucan branching enzyme
MSVKTAILVFCCTVLLSAQVVTTIPLFPTENDSIRIVFNAAEGDQGLMDYSGDVYTHTGLITEYSTSPSDWKYEIGSWGNNINQPQLVADGGDIYHLDIPNVRDFYSISNENEEIEQLAFVFRSSDSQLTGRDVGGADIFVDLYLPGITVVFLEPQVAEQYESPQCSPVFTQKDDTVHIVISAAAIGTETAGITLLVNDEQVAQTENDTLLYDFLTESTDYGIYQFQAIAEDTGMISDSATIAVIINLPVEDALRPENTKDGINYINETSVVLSLFAPYKDYVYVLGDFNDWKVDTTYYMKRDMTDEDNVHWWLYLTGLTPGQEYAFQYLVDGDLRVGDPYTDKILDPWNDQYISSDTYPGLKSYPEGKTSEIVSILQTAKESFDWEITDFGRPANSDLVIYELLIRDFIADHDYQTLIDTLDYLENLGINAVELMPVNEFEGNISWGYNPSFYFAPDKYYGPADDLKRFIDECHKRGIAVLTDQVLNHVFGQSPFVRLYNEGNYGSPTPDNPWLNVEARHPYNVGYDFNHESVHTQYLVDRVTEYWLTEFKVDGFRFDLSKGFTQKYTTSVAAWGQYDPSRIAILKRMADKIWDVDSTAYVILEHFADAAEDKELADYGMMVWTNMNTQYGQSSMGWLEDSERSSDLSSGYYLSRGLLYPHLVAYMESHDEQWIMDKNLEYGRSSGDYNIQSLTTALDRIKLIAVFFFTIPGPKMIWQFGELGYDEHLPEGDEPGRTDPKPIRWDYFNNTDRYRLYQTFAALLKLRNENEVFRNPEEVSMRVGQGQYERRINLTHPSMNVTVIGNFHVTQRNVNPNFQKTGTWYDYFSGDSIYVTDTQALIKLFAGEFHIYTDIKLPAPSADIVNGLKEGLNVKPYRYRLYQNYPNPFNPETSIRYELAQSGRVKLEVFNVTGKKIANLVDGFQQAGVYEVHWKGNNDAGIPVASGIYFYRLVSGGFESVYKTALIR